MFLWEKRSGSYHPSTYQEIRDRVHRCAAGLLSLGIEKGDRIALLSEGRNDWVVAELGILYCGAINVPLSVKIDELSELQFRISHAQCRAAFVSARQMQKIESLRSKLPDLERVVCLDGQPENGAESDMPLPELLDRGFRWLKDHPGLLENAWQSVAEGDPATISYTSGTVADPKGIVLTHRNYTANVEQSVALYPLPKDSCTLLILPWDHSFAHTDGIYALASCGGAVASVAAGTSPMETLRNIPQNIREIRPTLLLSVPSLSKSFRKAIEAGIRERGPLLRMIFAAATAVAYAYNSNGANRGAAWRVILKPLCFAFDLMVFRKVRASFGGRLQYFVGGGALLDIDLQRFFCAIGIPVYQGYGLTEAAPVISANTPGKHKFGTSGIIAPRLELRICDASGRGLPQGREGEIVVKGENVMAGYWRNDKATAETLRDGWLFTGDLGYVDADGYLVVLGRKKSLLIGHDGEKYSPEGIEETIVARCEMVEQIMLYNSQSPYTAALVVPNRDAIARFFKKHHHLRACTKHGQDALLRQFEHDFRDFRAQHSGIFPERWLPAAFGLLSEPFSEQNKQLNSTMKMARGRIAASHDARLRYLYTAEGKDICNDKNRETIDALFSERERTSVGKSPPHPES